MVGNALLHIAIVNQNKNVLQRLAEHMQPYVVDEFQYVDSHWVLYLYCDAMQGMEVRKLHENLSIYAPDSQLYFFYFDPERKICLNTDSSRKFLPYALGMDISCKDGCVTEVFNNIGELQDFLYNDGYLKNGERWNDLMYRIQQEDSAYITISTVKFLH